MLYVLQPSTLYAAAGTGAGTSIYSSWCGSRLPPYQSCPVHDIFFPEFYWWRADGTVGVVRGKREGGGVVGVAMYYTIPSNLLCFISSPRYPHAPTAATYCCVCSAPHPPIRYTLLVLLETNRFWFGPERRAVVVLDYSFILTAWASRTFLFFTDINLVKWIEKKGQRSNVVIDQGRVAFFFANRRLISSIVIGCLVD